MNVFFSRKIKLKIKFIKVLCILTVLFTYFFAFAHRSEGADYLHIEQKNDAYIGCEVVLSLGGDVTNARNATFEWVFEGNAKPILLRKGGLECQFTPVDTKSIIASVSAMSSSGEFLASADLTLAAKEFSIEIAVIKSEPFMLWDAKTKQDKEANGLIAGELIQLEAQIKPDYDKPIDCTWNTDASTAIRSGKKEQKVTIVRNEIGDAEISILIKDANGITLGRSKSNINVPIPRAMVDDSNRRRKAWNQWLKAQSLWDAKNFDDAIANATEASSIDPETTEITNGCKVMDANYARVVRSRKLTADAVALYGEQKFVEALKIYRRAYAAWALTETETAIKTLESEVDKIRIRQQQVEWLKDTASAYDQEGFFENALKYYKETLALQPDEGISQRTDRIEKRLASIAQAKLFSDQGQELELKGQLLEAIEKYKESLNFEASQSLETHTKELEETVKERRSRAATLRREASDLRKRDNDAEALLRYQESQSLWPDEDLVKIISDMEKTVKETSKQPIRTPEDFGIGTQADATRLLQEGHELYKQGKYREALSLYQKSFAISNDERLADWISRVETSLKEYESVLQANLLIKEANNLYNVGNHSGALVKYKESLSVHTNAEVENFIKMLESSSSDIKSR